MQYKPLKIGIIVPEFPSYTETFFMSQVKGLCVKGHTVTVFCTLRNQDDTVADSFHLGDYRSLRVRQLRIINLVYTSIKAIFIKPNLFVKGWQLGDDGFRKSLYASLCRIFFNYHYCDVYHFGYTGTAIAFHSAMEGLMGKIMVSCRGTAENVKPLTEPGRISKLYTLFDIVAKVHCVSGHMAELVKRYGASANKIFVNRPAVDTTYFSRSFAYPQQSHIRILSVGRLIFQKGLVTGLFALRRMIESFPAVEWVIVGDGPDYEELGFAIAQLGIRQHIQLAGKKTREEILAYYHSADIFFLPSVSEGIANVVLEAMSMELPVVSTDAGGMSEVITHGENGLIAPVDDHLSMAVLLVKLAVDYHLRKNLGKAARATMISRYHIDRYIDCFEREYRQLTA